MGSYWNTEGLASEHAQDPYGEDRRVVMVDGRRRVSPEVVVPPMPGVHFKEVIGAVAVAPPWQGDVLAVRVSTVEDRPRIAVEDIEL